MKKNSKMSKEIGIILSLALVFGLTACGNAKETKSEVPVKDVAAVETPVEDVAAVEASGEDAAETETPAVEEAAPEAPAEPEGVAISPISIPGQWAA